MSEAESCRKTCPYTRYCKTDVPGLKCDDCARYYKIEDIINDAQSAHWEGEEPNEPEEEEEDK